MEPTNFEEFWAFYVGEHRNPTCRLFHYVGTSAGYAVAAVALATLNPWLIPVGLVVGYGPAWIGHFFIEKNKPASFKYPLWSFFGDAKMLSFALRGRMTDEVARLEKVGFRVRTSAVTA